MEAIRTGNLRKKKFYFDLIKNKYGITSLQFNDKIHSVLMDLSEEIREKYSKILKVENKKGKFKLKIPKGLKIIDKPSLAVSRLKFTTDFDNTNYISNAILTLDFSWMIDIFKKHFQ